MGDVHWRENVGSVRIVDNNRCVWKIPSILLLNLKSSVASPVFTLEGKKWRIAKVKHMLHLWNEDSNPADEVCNVALTINDLFGVSAWSCQGETNEDCGYGRQLFNERSAIEIPELTNGAFLTAYCMRFGYIKIFCQVEKKEVRQADDDSVCEATNKTESSIIEDYKEPEETQVEGLERLAQNLKKLLMDGQNSDVVLKASDREFPAHRAILGARSPVFASMFQHDMKEKTSGVVDIPDCTAESFEVFLLYLYTGSAEKMSCDNVSNLYYAADKYRFDDLKKECVQFMKDNMSVENICDFVALSLKHTETELLKHATDFFRCNIKKILKTVKWQIFMSENSAHANELLIKAHNA